MDHADTSGSLIEVLADGVFEEFDMVEGFITSVTDTRHEILDRLRGVSTTAETLERRHTRIVPT